MKIKSYGFGKMSVDGVTYTNDLIIFPDKIEPEWWREKGHSLSLKDLESVIKYKPDYLIIGRGAQRMMTIPPETEKAIKENDIEVISGDTKEMTELFNQYLEEGKNVVGAFHLTC